MKRWIYFLGHLAIVTVLMSFATISLDKVSNDIPEELQRDVKGQLMIVDQEELLSSEQIELLSPRLSKNFIGFKEVLGFKESQGNYLTVNSLGYLGKYQFGLNTLKLMGINDAKLFLSNANLQERIFELNVSRNKWILRRDIKRFVGKRINGVVITESGIVAAAHLAGAGNVKKYLRSYGQNDFSDAYGSTIAYYIKKFGGYDVSEIKAQHNPSI